MNEKRFKIYQDSIRKFESNRIWGIKSETNYLEPYMTFEEAEKCCDLLNEQQFIIDEQKIAIDEMITDYKNLEKENELLKKQIQIYEQLISNSYVGEEETLDGFVGKYVIWEDELQKYRKKIKKGD